jgi:hypothetical protein
MLCHPLSDDELLLLCRPPADSMEFLQLLNQISIKIIDFGHPGPLFLFVDFVVVFFRFSISSAYLHILIADNRICQTPLTILTF